MIYTYIYHRINNKKFFRDPTSPQNHFVSYEIQTRRGKEEKNKLLELEYRFVTKKTA